MRRRCSLDGVKRNPGIPGFRSASSGLQAGAAQSSDLIEETHRIVLQTLSDDGTVSDVVLKDLLQQTKLETGVKKEINIRDIVDYSFVRQIHKEMR